MSHNDDAAYYFGGHLEDVPLPHKRRWPGSTIKRDVKLRISNWMARWWAEVIESENPIWDSAQEVWRFCWDDKGGRGGRRIDGGKFSRKSEALHWGLGILDTEFPDHEHHINCQTRFDYLREGD
ncbi:MAG: hypothetical protein KAJ19_17295 [Gammaproteobacteria bacterium]|nr:hypothetical protein [Gammaproteobacteria bacterium]